MKLATSCDSGPLSASQTDRPSFARASWIWAVLWAMLVLYGSLIPFDIDFSMLSESPGLGVFAIAPVRTTFVDAATNILVYLPLGLALALSGWATRIPRGLSITLATAVGAVLSLSVEAMQSAISIRVAAQSDVYFNVAGTMLGALLAPTLVRTALAAMGRLS